MHKYLFIFFNKLKISHFAYRINSLFFFHFYKKYSFNKLAVRINGFISFIVEPILIVDRWELAYRRFATNIVLGVAFARRRVATAEHAFRLLHSVAFDQRCYANVISATSLSSTFRIGGLTIDTVFLAVYRRRVPRAVISPSRTISPLDATFLFPFRLCYASFNYAAAMWLCAICSSARKCHSK